jgi:hypothetical protein
MKKSMKSLLPALLIGARFLVYGESLPEPAEGSNPPKNPDLGRVLIVESSRATVAFTPQLTAVTNMLERGLLAFTGKESVAKAWRGLISTQDVVGIKVFSAPGRNSGTRPVVVAALIESLLKAGVSPGKIIVWDRRLGDLRSAGFHEFAERYGVRLAGSQDEGYDPDVSYDTALLGKLVYGDLEFGKRGEGVGRRSFLSKVVTKEITRFITVSPLLNNNLAGISGALYGATLGNVDNILRFELDNDRLAVAIPEIYALPQFSERAALHIMDGLICQYQGEERTMLHYASALNQLWFSTDPVALDVLGIKEINRERAKAGQPEPKINRDIYSNAEILDLGIADAKGIKIEKLKTD